MADNETSKVVDLLPMSFDCEGTAGCIDRVEGAPLPLLRAFGWYAKEFLPAVLLHTDQGRCIAPAVASRNRREDVVAAGETALLYCGMRLDFVLEPDEQPVSLHFGDDVRYAFPESGQYSKIIPHYMGFFTSTQVMGRDSIYGSGPPMDVAAEFKEFASLVSGRVLDFGCGNGDMLAFLRGRGHDAAGLELDDARIRNVLHASVADHVTLYPGGCPLPLPDADFDWVVSTEVIEHVADIGRYVPELARILRPGGRLLITTPDITSIPSSFPANCVPWHLLESTHINFFTPGSVRALFASHFDLLSTYCLGASRINGYFVPGSVGAVFQRR